MSDPVKIKLSRKKAQEQIEAQIAIDLSRYIIGLKLSRRDAKQLQANIIYKLKKHHHNGSLTYLDETDIMQMVCERIIMGKRNWNKKTNKTPLDFLLSCASSIIFAEGKSKRNQLQQKNSPFELSFETSSNTLQPLEEVIADECKTEIMKDIATKKPELKEMAEQFIFEENVETQTLADTLKTTNKDTKNKQRTFRRYLAAYLRRKS